MNAQDDRRRAPLHGAAMLGHDAVAALLLAHGARADVLSDAGESPLACAAAAGHVALCQLLLGQGAAVDYCEGERRRTPLFCAALHGHVDVVALLLEHGAAVQKSEGWTEACESALADGIQRLVDRGADLQVRPI